MVSAANISWFGTWLRERRLEAGIGMRRFAIQIGVLPSDLCDVENSRVRPWCDHSVYFRIAGALGIAIGSDLWSEMMVARIFDGKEVPGGMDQ